jgi:hypothetical protein
VLVVRQRNAGRMVRSITSLLNKAEQAYGIMQSLACSFFFSLKKGRIVNLPSKQARRVHCLLGAPFSANAPQL